MELNKKLNVINLYGGPGTGKSTTAAALFALMKRNGINVELVTEFAKDLVWTERNKELGDQIYIFGKMYHKLWRLRDKVDYVIIDSPLPLCVYYDRENLPGFKELVFNMYNSFTNYNFRLRRKFKYQEEGRYQTEVEADKVDEDLIKLVEDNGVEILDVCTYPNPEYDIFKTVFGLDLDRVEDICQQIIHNNIVYGESAVLVDNDNNTRILSPEELDELRKQYDFNQMKLVDLE